MTAKALTANRLSDGGVVYLTDAGDWSEDLQQAAVAADEAREIALSAQAEQAIARCEIVDPYLIPVVSDDGRLLTASQRERIRAGGPTVETDPAPSLARRALEAVHVSL